MHSFDLHLPTRLLFGADQREVFAEQAATLGKHAFVVTGGGSVVRLGYLDNVRSALEAAGVKVTLFSGIEPNPESATVDKATALLRTSGADFVVAVGGGSAMDAAKAIALLAATPGADHVWPYVMGEPKAGQFKAALPLATVPTTAATASEVTPYAVISNRSVSGKSVLAHDFIKPRVSWLNPEFTVALPAHVTQDGAADILSHVFENYVAGDAASFMADRHTEAVISTVLEVLPALLKNPTDVNLRGQLLWASTLALSGFQGAGRSASGFPLHAIEHALSGVRPELAHGRGLATLFPPYFRLMHRTGRATARFAQLGRRIFGVHGCDKEAAEAFLERFDHWLEANGLRQTLTSLGFKREQYPAIAAYTVRVYGDGKSTDAGGPLTAAQVVEILEAAG